MGRVRSLSGSHSHSGSWALGGGRGSSLEAPGLTSPVSLCLTSQGKGSQDPAILSGSHPRGNLCFTSGIGADEGRSYFSTTLAQELASAKAAGGKMRKGDILISQEESSSRDGGWGRPLILATAIWSRDYTLLICKEEGRERSSFKYHRLLPSYCTFTDLFE